MLLAVLLGCTAEAARGAKAARAPAPPPEPDGWWDPTRDTWSPEALAISLRQLESKAAPSGFLGDTTGMTRGVAVEWAWIAEGFEPEAYASVALAPARNGMGRYKLVGEQRVVAEQRDALRAASKAWRKAEIGTDADLVVYTQLHWYLASEHGVAWVVENLGVDADKRVVFRAQYIVGTAAGTGSPPSDRDRYGYLAEAAREAGADLAAALTGAPGAPGASPSPLHCERAALMSSRTETFGPALNAQIAAAVGVAADASVSVELRVERVRALGHLGGAAAVPLLTQVILDTAVDERVRDAAAWALGEVGHPNALPALAKARGVNAFLVKTAIAKIDLY